MNTPHLNKTRSLLIVLVAYIACLVAGYISLRVGEGHLPPLWNMFVADVVATFVIWFFSLAVRNASMYDPYWSVIPVAIAAWWIATSAMAWDHKAILTFTAICYWAIRLTLNWVRGWSGLGHQDWRYKMLEDKNPGIYWLTNLGGIHLFPTIVVYLCIIPVYFIATQFSTFQWPYLIGGFIISILATTIEFVADEQMRSFRKSAKPDEYIDRGLWRYSRHPNYFGEISFWLGLFVMSRGVADGMWWTGIGVVVIAAMFLFASIPMMEERTLASKPTYAAQIKKVSILIPWFRKS